MRKSVVTTLESIAFAVATIQQRRDRTARSFARAADHFRTDRPRAAFIAPKSRVSLAVGLTLLIWLVGGFAQTLAYPLRESQNWSVLLCKYSDSETPPAQYSVEYYRSMFTVGGGGLGDYWSKISAGGFDLGLSTVHGWYTVPMTVKQAKTLSRIVKTSDCIAAAANSKTVAPFVVPPESHVVAIGFPDTVEAGAGNQYVYEPFNADIGDLAHEIGHQLNLVHSSSNGTFCTKGWGDPRGVYDDPWDLMSYRRTYTAPTSKYGNAPASLNAYNLDRLGWLPRSRVFTLGADGSATKTVTLAALGHPEVSGYFEVRVPFDIKDPWHYYTVEYRTADGYDAGIGENRVLIHEVKASPEFIRCDGTTAVGAAKYTSYIQYDLSKYKDSGLTSPVAAISSLASANGVTITSFPTTNSKQAQITVKSEMADWCRAGFVWREAVVSDRICVPPSVRGETKDENVQAQTRHVPGAQGCLEGFVWREAFAGDLVCAPPSSRQRAQADNDAAASRRYFADTVYGQNTCKTGFVWREADDRDYVCVTLETRAAARADNLNGPSRKSTPGAVLCAAGFVWREAFHNDLVCVLPATREAARADNIQATARVARPD